MAVDVASEQEFAYPVTFLTKGLQPGYEHKGLVIATMHFNTVYAHNLADSLQPGISGIVTNGHLKGLNSKKLEDVFRYDTPKVVLAILELFARYAFLQALISPKDVISNEQGNPSETRKVLRLAQNALDPIMVRVLENLRMNSTGTPSFQGFPGIFLTQWLIDSIGTKDIRAALENGYGMAIDVSYRISPCLGIIAPRQ